LKIPLKNQVAFENNGPLLLKMNREAKSAEKRRPRCEGGFLPPKSLAVKPGISEARI
jgi:hypothetical protein